MTGFLRHFALASIAVTAAVAALMTANVARADTVYTYTLAGSCCSGGAPFGTLTVHDAGGGTYNLTLNMSPNNLLGTGSHFALTFDMAGGTISALSSAMTTAGFSIAQNGGASTVNNAPFGDWNYAIGCSNNPTAGCGTSLALTITGA